MKFKLFIPLFIVAIFATLGVTQTEPPDHPDPCKHCDDKWLACRDHWWCQPHWCDNSCNIDVCKMPECHHKCGYDQCNAPAVEAATTFVAAVKRIPTAEVVAEYNPPDLVYELPECYQKYGYDQCISAVEVTTTSVAIVTGSPTAGAIFEAAPRADSEAAGVADIKYPRAQLKPTPTAAQLDHVVRSNIPRPTLPLFGNTPECSGYLPKLRACQLEPWCHHLQDRITCLTQCYARVCCNESSGECLSKDCDTAHFCHPGSPRDIDSIADFESHMAA